MSFQTLDQAISLKLKVTTLLDQEITGSIYTFSSSNEVLVLITSNHERVNIKNDKDQDSPSSINQTATYRIINTSFIKSIQVLNPPLKKVTSKSNKGDRLVIEPINVDDLEQFLQEQIGKYQAPPVDHDKSSTRESASQHGSSKTQKSTTQPNQAHPQQTSPPTQHQNQHQHQHQHQHRHQHNQKPISSQLHDKLSAWFGTENVSFGNQKHSEIIVHNDIKLIKPFTNTQKNVQVLNKQTKHLPALNRALKQFWESIDNEKKGG
ncbi:hypothetical protein CANMA_000787 [Candida margitis]|uniref:uncharacterized protein n=1 Tax=Candida margitis TaxID=1775924 RepID=UPI0022277243|nr:uncharacterized protein CANMA_000787 [Candida margitis]KAI5970176.1 hypothetical protein CANMA_000787 [Candida margitis]